MSGNLRSATPIIRGLRNFFNRRDSKYNHRHENNQSARSQALPNLPFGVSHKLETNYYYGRDGRRESMPAVVTYAPNNRAIESGATSGQENAPTVKTPVPGLQTINWDM